MSKNESVWSKWRNGWMDRRGRGGGREGGREEEGGKEGRKERKGRKKGRKTIYILCPYSIHLTGYHSDHCEGKAEVLPEGCYVSILSHIEVCMAVHQHSFLHNLARYITLRHVNFWRIISTAHVARGVKVREIQSQISLLY